MYNSVNQILEHNAKNKGDTIAVADKSGDITYSEYWDLILKTAYYFKEYGIKSNQNVVIVTHQDRIYLSIFHALQAIGAIPVPLERNTKPEKVQEICSFTDAVLCISDTDFDFVSSLKYEDIKPSSDKLYDYFNEPDAVAEILFTTGTTGQSKGVVVTNSADVAVAENIKYGVEMKENNSEIIPMPVNHAFGLRSYFANVLNGGTSILLEGVINMKALFEAFDKYNATAFAMNPAALSILLKMAAKKLQSLADRIDYMQFGSAHLPGADKDRIKSLLPSARLYDFYGSSEAGRACLVNFNADGIAENCIGRAAKNAEFVTVDENGDFIKNGSGVKGRLVCRGAMTMKEYYKEPGITAETLRNGYVYSNDLCEIDENGYIYFYGRCDDVITCGGFKIAPQEVEDVVNECPFVKDSACIGIPDEISGSVPKLFVVPGAKYLEEELIKYLSDRLEFYQMPKKIQIIDEIPRTFNGKPLRRLLVNK